ncbi:MAG: Fe-S oxidoreductase, related to NifB/MoaA family [Clostridia bacterium]|nr:Fe-S oxidoreductase, related to NifB/MoaA family [Clostridia bacterium]
MKALNYKEHKIVKVEKDSIAEEMGIESGDTLIWINEENIEDVFDYQYSLAEEEIEVCIRKLSGEEWILEIEKDGNYITLTNMKQKDIDRLIKHRLSPINISIHATDEKVRIDLLNNRFAGDIIGQIKTLIEAGIKINGQIVLCKGINDGAVLDKTIEDLSQFIPHILSLTVVPVGISKFREGLAVLEGFDKSSACEVLSLSMN